MNAELAAPAGQHLLQFYVDVDSLSRGVAAYLADGARRGERLLVVATPEHAGLFGERLMEAGVDVPALLADGRLTRLDARETLDRISLGGRPDEGLFQEHIGALVRDTLAASRGKGLRIFGEMVDLLWRQGRAEEATELEQMWNRLLDRQRFSLYCAYSLDLFSVAARPPALGSHTRLLPAGVDGRLERAVEAAMRETLGPEAVEALLPLIRATQHPRALRPGPEATLLWVRNHLPRLAGEVLARSRARFEAEGAAG